MDEKPLSYQFDNVQVDLQTFKVRRAGHPVPLEPKAFEVLVFLIARRGRMVEKSELLDAVWKDTFVTPNALTRVIAHLRRLLGDDAKEARYIETVPKRGYRFIAEVEVSREANSSSLSAAPLAPAPSRVAPRPKSARLWAPGIAVMLLLLLGLGWLWRMKPDTRRQPAVLRTSQITTTQGLDFFPSFSPDGASIVYSSMRSSRFELFVRQLAPGGREIQITANGEQNLQPAWSPDGTRIAYHSRRRGGICVIPALGGVARHLTEFGSRPAWSPDGAFIVFQSDAPADLAQTAFGAFPPSTLWIVGVEGGPPRQLTRKGDPPGGHGAPAWSPDGKRIAFVTYAIGASSLWSVSPAGGDLKRWRDGDGILCDPVFSPDGRSLYFSTASGNFRLWRAPLSSEGLPVGEAIEISNTGNALARHLTVAPDGKRLAYSSMSVNNNIASIDISAKTHEATTAHKLLTQDTNFRKTAQAFSPDGKTIIYSVWRLGADGEVWLMDADGGNPRQLITEPAGILGWLPQGDQVVLSMKNPGARRLFKVDVKDGRMTPLTNDRFPARFGRLSPDGRQIAFHQLSNGIINLHIMSLETGAVSQLTFDQELVGFPAWSPDSRFIAAQMKRGDDCHVVVVSSSSSDAAPEQLTFERGESWPGGWSPDGDMITFAGLRDGVWNVWWVSRKTKMQKRVTDYREPNTYVRYPAWSPRDNQIVYEYAETVGNIWMLELK